MWESEKTHKISYANLEKSVLHPLKINKLFDKYVLHKMVMTLSHKFQGRKVSKCAWPFSYVIYLDNSYDF